MDGTIAQLDKICALADRYEALVRRTSRMPPASLETGREYLNTVVLWTC